MFQTAVISFSIKQIPHFHFPVLSMFLREPHKYVRLVYPPFSPWQYWCSHTVHAAILIQNRLQSLLKRIIRQKLPLCSAAIVVKLSAMASCRASIFWWELLNSPNLYHLIHFFAVVTKQWRWQFVQYDNSAGRRVCFEKFTCKLPTEELLQIFSYHQQKSVWSCILVAWMKVVKELG
jgi:hypothetical protein